MKDVNKKDRDEGEVGDVETAGETTAAAAPGHPTHDKLVGEDTMVKVSEKSEPGRAKGDDD